MIVAVVDISSRSILNRIVIDDEDPIDPPQGCVFVTETVQLFQIGGTIVDGIYTPPPSLPAPPL